MPRTPLLQRLVDVVTAAGESVVGGVAADASPRGPVRPTRREFVGGALGVVGLVACERAERVVAPVRLAAARGAPGGGGDVAIVGAGLAGLVCAYRLREAGIVATVYEATTRVGGRCWTRRGDFADGQIAEHGGELIDQSHKAIRHLSQQLGLSLDNVLSAEANGTEPLYYFGGAPYRYDEATRDTKAVWPKLHRDLVGAGYPTTYASSTPRGRELDRMSIADWIRESVPGGLGSRLGQLLATAYTIEYGAEADGQSALNLVYLLGYSGQGQLRIFGPSNEKYHVRGGNDQIVTRLAAALPGQLVTGAPLTAVARTRDGRVTLTFGGGSPRSVTADRAVLALPFSILASSVNVRDAGFDARKLRAIRELGMGANAKLNVQFSSRHWRSLGNNGDTFAGTGYQATWEVSRAQGGVAGILVNYTGGRVAAGLTGSADTLARRFLDQIEPVLPGLRARWNGRATIDHWPTNPWTRGSYSYWKPGQYTAFAGAEGEPAGACHFAGEHTSIDAQGYLEGAVESGERAAREVEAALAARAA
jgi:monoamine oxidase